MQTARENLYTDIKRLREKSGRTNYRLFISGYLNEEGLKRETNFNLEQFVRSHLNSTLGAYVYGKESSQSNSLVDFVRHYHNTCSKTKPMLHTSVRVVYQSYQDPYQLLSAFDADIVVQPGPVLGDTDKAEDQILDRAYQVYDIFEEGLRKKKDTPSHRVGNMILLSNDDMSILTNARFMTLEEYCQLYVSSPGVTREADLNYPLPPNIFDVIEFIEHQS